MRRFACLSLAFTIAACSGGTADSPGVPVVDTGLASDSTADDTAPADTDVVDTADGFVACKADGDCAMSADGKVCDVASGKCVPCSTTSDLCAPTEHCEANKCVGGCKNDDGCAPGSGDAGVDADGGETGAPTKTKCDTAAHACVECVKDEHCAAGFLCVGNVCSAGCSTTKACPTGETCCSGACVDTVTNTDHCGACGTKCSVVSGTAKCEASTCKIATCTAPMADCDSNYGTGCETDTSTATNHCGSCGTVCALAGSTPKCEAGVCKIDVCTGGYGNCDGIAANGCETDLLGSVAHCGACGNACPTRPNSSATCAMGACRVSCGAGFENCDGSDTNGCEVSTLSDPAHCGACGNACSVANGTPACALGSCAVGTCNVGFGNCDGNASNGCEVNVTNNVSHCGACGNACTVANGTASCVFSTCGIAACTAPYRDCDLTVGNGCETNTSDDVNNCGACGNRCTVANGTGICTTGVCQIAGCTGTFKSCNSLYSDGCETDTATSASHCGACGNACPAGASCNLGTCTFPTSCQAIRTTNPAAPSGMYRIDPDGPSGPTAAFDVYCEMIGVDGWTLALKANGAATTFAYSAAHWTTNTTLNPTSTNLSLTEAKFQSFNTMPFTQLRLGMVDAGVPRYITVNATGSQSLMATLAAGYLATTATRTAWLSLVATPRMQANCNREGLSNAVGTYASVRIGILANQEGDCGSPDSFLGFGGGPVACLSNTTPLTVGNVGSCGAVPSDGQTATWGYVFIR